MAAQWCRKRKKQEVFPGQSGGMGSPLGLSLPPFGGSSTAGFRAIAQKRDGLIGQFPFENSPGLGVGTPQSGHHYVFGLLTHVVVHLGNTDF